MNSPIFTKYADAIDDALGCPTTVPVGTMLLALRLAIAEASETAPATATTHNCKYVDQRLGELSALLAELESNNADLRQQLATLQAEVDHRRLLSAAYVADINELQAQLAQMDADNADLTRKLAVANSHITALTDRIHASSNGAELEAQR